MSKKKRTRRTMINSVISLIICFSLLLGTTFAWFTDSVESKNNIIKAGNLDVELYYQAEGQADWTRVTETTNVFMENTLWEPGHTEVVKLKVVNEGTLALKYQLGINIVEETGSKNMAGEEFLLSDHIYYGVVDGEMSYTRDQAVAAVEKDAVQIKNTYSSDELALLEQGQSKIVTFVAYMPTVTGNEANYGKNQKQPEIKLGINLFATQKDYEEDSFGLDYDEAAPWEEIEVTAKNIQEYLDGQHGSLGNKVLVLTDNEGTAYSTLYLARPTKYAGSNTEYYCGTHEFASTDAEVFAEHLNEAGYHNTPKYTTTLKNLKLTAEENVTITVAGVEMSTGHVYGDVYDYVLDKDYDVGSAYYCTAYVENVSFDGIVFTSNSDFNTSDADTVYDGVTFVDCTFKGTGTDSSNGSAIRYYNEANNGNVKNITVANCTFTKWHQGVYTQNVNGITVKNSEFMNLGHNAIAVQSLGGNPVAHKAVVIERNIFENIKDRIIRFGDIADDTQISIMYNLAKLCGDEYGEVIKATSIADGVIATVKYNDWGDGKAADNSAVLENAEEAEFVENKSSLTSAITNAEEGDVIVLVEDLDLGEGNSASLTIEKPVEIDLNGKTIDATNGWGIVLLKEGASLRNGIIDVTTNVAAIRAFETGTIENVTINITPKNTDKVVTGIAVQEGYHVQSIKNVKITGATQGIELLKGATVDLIENAEVHAAINGIQPGTALEIKSGNAVKVMNSSFTGETYGIHICLESGYTVGLKLENCDVTGGTASIYAHNKGTITNLSSSSLTLTYDEATDISGDLLWEFDESLKDVVHLNAPIV